MGLKWNRIGCWYKIWMEFTGGTLLLWTLTVPFAPLVGLPSNIPKSFLVTGLEGGKGKQSVA